MRKTRRNGNEIVVNLETLCLDCGRRGFITFPIKKKGNYEIYDSECPSCKKITKHIKCKSIEDLKSKLEFDSNYCIDGSILKAMDGKKIKSKKF